MSTQSFKIELGDPKIDAPYLAHGLDVSFSFQGWPGEPKGRPVAKRAAIRVPLAKKGPTRLKLTFSPHVAQEGRIVCQGEELASFSLAQGEGKTVEATIPEGLARSPALVEIISARDFPRPHWFGKSLVLAEIEIEGEGVEPLKTPRAPELPKRSCFFGDLHVHSSLSLCAWKVSGSLEENYDYARGEAGHDFTAVTDHAEHMDEDAWRRSQETADRFDEPGSFATLVGYEWTSELYGHRNVYFRSRGPLVDAVDYDTHRPEDLWRRLREHPGPDNAITVPHHPTCRGHLLDWSHFDREFDRLVEVRQSRGRQDVFEMRPSEGRWSHEPGATVRDALARGYVMGFVGGSDAHQTKAGHAAVTGIWAEELTREALFEALKNRSCFATTAPGIELDFRANGHPAGSVLRRNLYAMCAEFPINLEVRARGTAEIRLVEFFANGWLVHTEEPNSGEINVSFEFPHPSEKVRAHGKVFDFFWLTNFDRHFRARIEQADGHVAWASPVWFLLEREY